MGVSVVSLPTVAVTIPSCIHVPSSDGECVLDYTVFVNMLLLRWHWRWSESSLLRPRFHPYGTGQHTVVSDEPLVIRSCEHTDSCLTVVLCFSLPRRLLKSELGSFISDYFQVSSGGPAPILLAVSCHTNKGAL